MISEINLKQITEHGQNLEAIEKQIHRFETGFPYINIKKAAMLNNGIISINNSEIEHYISIYEKEKKHKTFAKFVPASGAATRMFKKLYEFIDNPNADINSDTSFYSVYNFFENIDKFAFLDDLRLILLNNTDKLASLIEQNAYKEILDIILSDHGLAYGYLPKGLLKFHKYEINSRTAIEEHLVEGALYAASGNKTVKIHFTVSPQFVDDFKCHIEQFRSEYEDMFDVKYKVEYSIQEPYTDTIAVDENNKPILDENGQLMFRPAGHGALIENLNRIDDDIIFVKNIDNVVPDRMKDSTITFKKVLAGILIENQKQLFSYIKKLQKNTDAQTIAEALSFITETFKFIPCTAYSSMSVQQKHAYVLSILNRPIRVCGMVKNENEPGGGPFIVEHEDGSCSLQIIESAQINKKDELQMQIANSASHFNPVDLVCGVKDFNGNKYVLQNFIDENAGIITQKSAHGKSLKALELPGLWNGAMANWNTLFVEVPLSTFNPVKEINDLLRNEHLQIV